MADGTRDLSPALPGTPGRRPGRVFPRVGSHWIVMALALAALLVEVAGRAFGLHTPVLYEATDYGYRVAPNQEIHRFGHSIRYNAMGLRNDTVPALPAPGVTRILCLGDSVTNGGAVTSQQDTITAKLEALLRRRMRQPEVLNASAPGWAIANEAGWLRTVGTLGSSYVVLIISTHDLFQDPAPSSTVDSHPSFPSTRPVLALQEVLNRYLLPRFAPSIVQQDPGAAGVAATSEAAARNRQLVTAIADKVENDGSRLVVVFLEQAGDNDGDLPTLAAKRRMFALLGERRVPVVTLGSEVERLGREAMFADEVHPTPAGNQVIAEEIDRKLRSLAADGPTSSPRGEARE